MGTWSPARTPKINLSKYVNIGGHQWRFCRVAVSANGRIKPDCVIVAGKPEIHREGAYYIEWYEKGKRRRRSVGKNASEAHAKQQRHIQVLRNEALGIEVVREKEEPDGTTISDSCAVFLGEVRERSRRKTHQQYSVALRYFQECCDKQVGEIGRSDLLKFLAFLQEEKKLSNRTAWTKLNVVVQWLKANGMTRLLKRNDWPRYVETEPETYSLEEVEQFLAACDPFERVLFEFSWMTGFPDAEVQHVTRADLDPREQVVRVTEKPQWGFIPKNWGQREVPIPDRLVESLEAPVPDQRRRAELSFPGCLQEDRSSGRA